MEGMKKSNENNSEKPCSLMDSSSLPLLPSSFQVGKKPFFMNYGDSGVSRCYYPPPPLSGDNKETTTNQNLSPPSDDHKMMIPSGDTTAVEAGLTCKAEHDLDPKRLKQLMSHRESAKKFRMKKFQYLIDLEKKAKSLEAEILILTPQVSYYQNKQEFLLMEKKSLNERMTIFNNNNILINAEIEENKAEMAELSQLHLFQQQQNGLPPVWVSGLEELLNSPFCQTPGPEQMVYANTNQFEFKAGDCIIGDQYNAVSIEEIFKQNQHNMKQVSVQRVDDQHIAADTNIGMMPPGWGTEVLGQMPNPGFNFESAPLENANMISLNNNMNLQDPCNGFI